MLKLEGFDLLKYLNATGGKGWDVIWRDSRLLRFSKINPKHIILDEFLSGERGFDVLNSYKNRLRAGNNTPLGAEAFQALLENEDVIPEDWKSPLGDEKILYIAFPGDEFKAPSGKSCILVLFHYLGRWTWDIVASEELTEDDHLMIACI